MMQHIRLENRHAQKRVSWKEIFKVHFRTTVTGICLRLEKLSKLSCIYLWTGVYIVIVNMDVMAA